MANLKSSIPRLCVKTAPWIALACLTAAIGCASDGGPDPSGTGATSGEGGMGGSTDSEGVGGRVDAVPLDTCYSPSAPENAYDEMAKGCKCMVDGEGGVCVRGASLLCVAGSWVALKDGPCEPRTEDCYGEFGSWSDCLTAFATCVETDAGSFCGYDMRFVRRTP